MSVFSKASMQRFLFGEPDYTEHEGLLAFQFRFLITIALSSVVFNLAFICATLILTPEADYLAFVVFCWIVAMVGNVALWLWLRAHPRSLHTGSLLLTALYWLTLYIPNYAKPPDPAVPMWSLPLIIGVFMMIGRRWGWIVTVIALASSHFMLARVDRTAFPDAMLTLWLATIASGVLGHIYVARFDHFFSRLAFYNERLLWLSSHDSLTSALNAEAYYERCNNQLALCRRLHLPYAVLFVDLDHFKNVNDNYGHATGDRVLVRVAKVLRDCLRETDLVGRVGGEEFSIFLTGTSLEDSRLIAEHIRSVVEAQKMASNGRFFQVTASIGLAWTTRSDQPLESIHDVQVMADKAMYEAKRSGRNQVALFTPETGQHGAGKPVAARA